MRLSIERSSTTLTASIKCDSVSYATDHAYLLLLLE